jgi:hypothetical protein
MRILIAALILAPAAASAQISLTLAESDKKVNATDCSRLLTATWQITATYGVCSDLKVFLTTAASCPAEPTNSDYVISSVDESSLPVKGTLQTSSPTFRVTSLPSTADGGSGCAPGVESTVRVCARVKVNEPSNLGVGSTCNATAKTSEQTVSIDGKPPATPGAPGLAPFDSKLKVSFEAPGEGDFSAMIVEFQPIDGSAPDEAAWTAARSRPTTSGFELTELENGVTYAVRLKAVDASGNVSDPSAHSEGTPIKTYGVGEQIYKGADIPEGEFYGCATGPGGHTVLPLLALGMVILVGLAARRISR